MSVGFRAVQWNRDKFVYDGILLAAVTVYMAIFAAISWRLFPPKNLPDAIDIGIRTFGTAAFWMLTVILSIGPLARLNSRFLPLLYNRRHLGVLTFLVAVVHIGFLLSWYIVQGNLPNLGGELTNWGNYGKFIGFPFKALGLAAFLIFFVMAATSHDFWLLFLRPRAWKAIHMAIYIAYALVVMHVALGSLQDRDQWPFVPLMLVGGAGTVAILHLVAAWREWKTDKGSGPIEGWIVVGAPQSIPDKAAKVVVASGGERIAVFRDGNQIGAVTNVCAHQLGPLGEGRIIDGCITCPWHGYQYRLSDGCAPPPFTEKLATYRVRLNQGVVEVDPRPLAPGTPAAITT